MSPCHLASLLFLNPPYDQHNGRRLETDFLIRATDALVDKGTLVYIIPTTALNWRTVDALLGRFEYPAIFRFPDDHDDPAARFDTFHQVIIIATKRDKPLDSAYTDPQVRQEAQAFFTNYGNRHTLATLRSNIRTNLQPTTPFPIPLARRAASIRRRNYTEDEIAQLATANWTNVLHQAHAHALSAEAELPQPLMPPKLGHIAQIVAAGLAGTIDSPGQAFKGRVIKSKVIEQHPDDPKKLVERDVYTTHVAALSPAGLQHLHTPTEVTDFLQDHADTFKTAILARFQPYGNTIQPWENARLDTLSLDKRLPGTKQAGLLPKQRECAVALTRAIRRYGTAHLVAEMGFGKTRTALASADLIDAYPLLVVCPPHLVDKWKRECNGAIPGATAHVVESITRLDELAVQHKPGQKLIIIISRSKIKLGAGWKKVTATRHTLPRKDYGPAQRAPFRQALAAYKANPCPETRRAALAQAIPYATCPGCGLPLDKYQKKSKQRLVCRGKNIATYAHYATDPHPHTQPWRQCNTALHQFGARYHRWPIADYIRKKLPRFFKMLITDEVHQYKAKGSDQGWAFGLLVNTIPASINLTGTFFGGPSSSIFWLLHRTQANVRHDFNFHNQTGWIRRFGVLETTWKLEEAVTESGAFSGIPRQRGSTKERPGISPAIVRYTLPTTIFASIADLNVAMPPFREEFVTLGLSSAMHADLKQVEHFTWDQLIEHWPHFTSAWLQWNLARPNSCFRDEVIHGYRNDANLECPAVIDPADLLPKEEWLLNKIKTELAQNRRVVVYARQTGTRDIRGRLRTILNRAGITSVAILDPKIPPRKREKWLQQHPARVLITNPKLVETGLDLVQYSTVIFYEVQYSLYTLWQACRRVWRLGQTRPVKCYYLAYEGTLEEQAYALIGQKIKAAQLLYGDEVGSALVDDPGDASLVMALIHAIQEGDDLTLDDSTTLFADETTVETTAVTGSPALPSPTIATFDDWLANRGLTREALKPTRRKRTPRTTTPSPQLTLF